MAKKMTKKEIYASFGIEYDNKTEKILSPLGWIKPLIINGNAKIGKGVWHLSTLPTNKDFDVNINNIAYTVKGTCPCHCVGCYAERGNYRYQSVKNALGIRTIILRQYPDFARRAINAQIQADRIETCRLHASGDFDSLEYIALIHDIVSDNQSVTWWTYTKNIAAENAFNDLSNINIVHSLIHGIGFNFGHIDYIIRAYNELKRRGEKVYICKCGIDKNQHCTNCKACSENRYVLFIEHSTEYKAEKDPLYKDIVTLIMSQESAKKREVEAA